MEMLVANRFLHYDLTAYNIMVETTANAITGRLWIMNFGHSHHYTEAELTTREVRRGTPIIGALGQLM